MTYVPKTESQNIREILADVVTLTGLIDLNPTGIEYALIKAFGRALTPIQRRLYSQQRAFGLKARGQELEDRVAQIMAGEPITRGAATAAFGQSLEFRRDDTSTQQTFAAGIIVARSDDSKSRYVTTEDFVMEIGEAVYPPPGDAYVGCRALTVGSAGRAPVGSIDTIVSTGTGLLSVTNPLDVAGGLDRERDDSLAARAALLISSLGRVQPAALKFRAERYTDADQRAVRWASHFADRNAPGYAELMIDDGEGFQGFMRPAIVTSGTVGEGGTQGPLFFDNPAATEPLVSINGGDFQPAREIEGAICLHEQGVIEFRPGFGLAEGTTWEIGEHKVFTGPIADLQRIFNGGLSAARVDFGYTASPNRVRVRPPVVQTLALRLQREYYSDVVPSEGDARLVEATIEYLRNVRPGTRYVRYDHYDFVRRALRDVVKNLVVVSPTQEVTPTSGRHRFITSSANITFV